MEHEENGLKAISGGTVYWLLPGGPQSFLFSVSQVCVICQRPALKGTYM